MPVKRLALNQRFSLIINEERPVLSHDVAQALRVLEPTYVRPVTEIRQPSTLTVWRFLIGPIFHLPYSSVSDL